MGHVLQPTPASTPNELTAQQVLHWHFDVIEVHLSSVGRLDAHLLLGRAAGHAPKCPLHDESGDLVLHFTSLGVLDGSLGKHCEDLGNATIADPGVGTEYITLNKPL